MTPQQLLSTWGRIVPKTVPLPVGTTHIVPFDPNRYLFCLWGLFLGDVTLVIGASEEDGIGHLFETRDEPLILTSALHGSLPMLGFRMSTITPGTIITYLEGVYPPQERQERKVPNNGDPFMFPPPKHYRGGFKPSFRPKPKT